MEAKHLSIKIYPEDRDMTKKWFVSYTVNGRRLKKYGRLSSMFTLAEKIAETKRLIKIINEECKVIEFETGPAKLDIADLVQKKFDEHCIYLRKNSITTYQSKITLFSKWYRRNWNGNDVRIHGIAISFLKYLKELKKSHTTINAYRATIGEFFGMIKGIENPFEKTKKFTEHRKSFMYFNKAIQEYLKKQISEVHPQLWLACKFQFFLLLRPDELRTIKVSAFNLVDKTVRMEGEYSKNGKTQFISIADIFLPELEFLKNYPPHFYVFGHKGVPGLIPRSEKYFPGKHQKILKDLKYDTRNYKFYSWKHSGAVSFYKETGDIKGLKEQGRWHSLDMVNEYLKNLCVTDFESIQRDFPAIGLKPTA